MKEARIGEDTDSTTFNLPEFADTDKYPDEIADDIATHFAAISQQFEPININKLSNEVRNVITQYNKKDVPDITEDTVTKLISITSNTKKGTKDDIPPILIKALLPVTNGIITKLFDRIAVTGTWPER